jgi:cobalamin-dependent methionine synthase I
MIGTVFTKTYSALPYNEREVLRYAGVKEQDDALEKLFQECLAEAQDKVSLRVCYAVFPVSLTEDGVGVGFANIRSTHLRKLLKNAQEVVVFAATAGIELDRLIARYNHASAGKAVVFQAIGAERVETLCNAFEKDLKTQMEGAGMRLTPRFSPGYGDLPLELQREIFRVLEPQKRIGVTLSNSLLMSPSKSVTAFIGLERSNCEEKKEMLGCQACHKEDCTYRD